MSERENILARIREALRVPAPHPASHPHGPTLGPTRFAQVLPPTGGTPEQNFALFQKNAAELRTDFRLLGSLAELNDALKQLAAAESWDRVASHRGSLTEPACQALGLPVLFTDAAYDKYALERVPAGISACDVLVAQTGSVVITSRSAGGRALSVLPPHHIVLARRDQMVGGLPEAFVWLKEKYGPDYPSMISLITGPSRTGDIERILVLGAHGPKKLTILCV